MILVELKFRAVNRSRIKNDEDFMKNRAAGYSFIIKMVWKGQYMKKNLKSYI